MTTRPQTIQIYLPKGDPRGIRVAEITTRIVQVIELARNDLDAFFEMPESQQVALYFLRASDDGSGGCVYIGQTGDVPQRLKSHHKNRDSWERALVLISRTNSLTQTHALFGVVLHQERGECRALRARKRQRREQTAHAAAARSGLHGDLRDGPDVDGDARVSLVRRARCRDAA
jgi:predicted GIY-YIG superfamily endonuclease